MVDPAKVALGGGLIRGEGVGALDIHISKSLEIRYFSMISLQFSSVLSNEPAPDGEFKFTIKFQETFRGAKAYQSSLLN